MSKGTPLIAVRIHPQLYAEMEATIERANLYRIEEAYDVSSFVRTAIREKIAHMKRSRRTRKRPRKEQSS